MKPFISTSTTSKVYNEASASGSTRKGTLKVYNEIEGELMQDGGESRLARWFNPNTRGGVIVWGTILLIIPCIAYQYFVSTGLEETQVGAYVGAIFVLLSNVLWASTYIFRVATKDMTYATQLRDYENAVLQKRLDELADDEITALMEEIELEEQEELEGGF